MDQRAEFDEELEEAWPEEDGLPQNAAEYQRQESVRHLRKENETLRRELKAAQRIQLAALALLQIVLIAATRTNSAIHDILAQTVVVDMESQMIFDSAREREARRREYAEADSARWGQ